MPRRVASGSTRPAKARRPTVCRWERARGERPPPNLAPEPQGSGALLFFETDEVLNLGLCRLPPRGMPGLVPVFLSSRLKFRIWNSGKLRSHHRRRLQHSWECRHGSAPTRCHNRRPPKCPGLVPAFLRNSIKRQHAPSPAFSPSTARARSSFPEFQIKILNLELRNSEKRLSHPSPASSLRSFLPVRTFFPFFQSQNVRRQ